MRVTQYIHKYKVDKLHTIVLNTLNGTLDAVDPALAKALRPGQDFSSWHNADEVAQLQARGYLVDPDDERTRLQERFDRLSESRSISFTVCPTYTCNLRCPYCFQDEGLHTNGPSLSLHHVDYLFAAMDQVVQAGDVQTVNLELFGGEPFLEVNRSLVERIIGEGALRGWMLSATTNGTELDKYFDLLMSFAHMFSQIQITIDGPPEVHDRLRKRRDGQGTFDVICANITRLLQLRIPVMVRVNVGPENVNNVPILLNVFDSHGWCQMEHFGCQLAPVYDNRCTGQVRNYQPEYKLLEQLGEILGNLEEVRQRYRLFLGYNLERRTELIRKAIFGHEIIANTRPFIGCTASVQQYLVFGADGLLYACPDTVGIAEAAIGSYLPALRLDREKWQTWNRTVLTVEECRTCSLSPLCGGGCVWNSMNCLSGQGYTPNCNYARQTVDAYLGLNKQHLCALLEATDC